jgi:hypothetical protein
MNNYKKYIKYKTKYLKLKKNLNNTQVGGRRVKTISNGGSREGMSNQCFWISILDYLTIHGYPKLTLRELRTHAGLDQRTEHTMFDIDDHDRSSLDRQAIFYNAAVQVAELYNLTIQVFTVDQNGNIIESAGTGGIRATIGNGPNRVNIAQFGLGHFELIVDNGGADFVPAVMLNNTLTKSTAIPRESRQDVATNLQQNITLIQNLKEQQKIYENMVAREEQEKKTTTVSTDFTKLEKKIFIEQHDINIQKFIKEIELIKKKISSLEDENLTYNYILRTL